MSGVITWSEAALRLFDLSADTAVSAGAGAGKTTALVELCVRLLSGEATGAPVEPSALAAITFTEKAAEELTERLRGAVAARVRGAEGPARAAWAERLRALDRMAVGTIHGFCGRLLREQAAEAGLDPEFTVLDEEQSSTLLLEAARGAVVAALDLADPDVRQLSSGLSAEGWNGGLVGLVASLVRQRATRGERAPPVPAAEVAGEAEAARDAVLEAAARLLETRADARTAGARDLMEGLARAGSALGAGDRAGPLTGAALPRLAALPAAVKGKRTGKGEEHLRAGRDLLVALGERVALLAAEALGAPQRAALAALVGRAEARYLAAKRAARALDFDDLLLEARDLLARDATLRAELRGRFGALLVDEYQDVNGVQQSLFDLLAGAGLPGDPPGPRAVAVGDLKQSIYRFRGADVGVFAGVIRRLGEPPAEGGLEPPASEAAPAGRVLHLAENHRSTAGILELVNEVSTVALRPTPGAPPRDYELSFAPADRLVARRPGGAAVAVELLVDGEKGGAEARRGREAEALAARVRALVSGEAGVMVLERGPDGVERPRRPRCGDVAILFRRLTALGPYERALRAAGLPVRVARGGGFYQASEVRDLAELLASLADPEDALAWAALLRSPLCALSDGALVSLAAFGFSRLPRLTGELLHGEAGDGPPPPRLEEAEGERLLAFLSTWRRLHALVGRLLPHELLSQAAEALDLEAALLAAPDGERRRRNLQKAIALARRFGEAGGTAAELAARWRALAARPPREPEADLDDGDAVAILSIHQSKGLEWPVVLVPDLGARARLDGARATLDADGRLCAAWYDPAEEAFVTTASLEAARLEDRRAASAESRRLLYVALTRARDLLVLSGEGPAGGDAWRELVEAAAAARPELVRRIPLDQAGTASSAPIGGQAGEGTAPLQAAPVEVAPVLAAPRLAGPPPLPAVRLAVTELVEYARCPRRHHLTRGLGLTEPRGERGGAEDDDPARATARGTLAHAMLAETDLSAPPLERRAQLAAVAARRGYDPDGPGVRRILREVARFADSPGGRQLATAAAAGRLRREVPFLLRLDGAPGQPACYLNGAIDALVLPARRGGPLLVVDFKYALARPGAAERYRLQLLAYAVAASRAHGGARVEARLQFLRGRLDPVDVTPAAADLAAFEAEAPGLAAAAARGEGDQPPSLLGRSEARCRAEGCGFVARCHGPPIRACFRPGLAG